MSTSPFFTKKTRSRFFSANVEALPPQESNNDNRRSSDKRSDRDENRYKVEKFIRCAFNPSADPLKVGAKAKLTPYEKQVAELKASNPDSLLMVECGHRMRFMGEDALAASRVLHIRSYTTGSGSFAMAAVPVYRVVVHARRLVAAGFKVALVRQMETAAQRKAGKTSSGSTFARSIVAFFTPGTVIDDDDPAFSDLIRSSSAGKSAVASKEDGDYDNNNNNDDADDDDDDGIDGPDDASAAANRRDVGSADIIEDTNDWVNKECCTDTALTQQEEAEANDNTSKVEDVWLAAVYEVAASSVSPPVEDNLSQLQLPSNSTTVVCGGRTKRPAEEEEEESSASSLSSLHCSLPCTSGCENTPPGSSSLHTDHTTMIAIVAINIRAHVIRYELVARDSSYQEFQDAMDVIQPTEVISSDQVSSALWGVIEARCCGVVINGVSRVFRSASALPLEQAISGADKATRKRKRATNKRVVVNDVLEAAAAASALVSSRTTAAPAISEESKAPPPPVNHLTTTAQLGADNIMARSHSSNNYRSSSSSVMEKYIKRLSRVSEASFTDILTSSDRGGDKAIPSGDYVPGSTATGISLIWAKDLPVPVKKCVSALKEYLEGFQLAAALDNPRIDSYQTFSPSSFSSSSSSSSSSSPSSSSSSSIKKVRTASSNTSSSSSSSTSSSSNASVSTPAASSNGRRRKHNEDGYQPTTTQSENSAASNNNHYSSTSGCGKEKTISRDDRGERTSFRLDGVTARDLEVFSVDRSFTSGAFSTFNMAMVQSKKGSSDCRAGSLFDTICHCRSSFGRRALRSWLENPLCSVTRIHERQQAVVWVQGAVKSDLRGSSSNSNVVLGARKWVSAVEEFLRSSRDLECSLANLHHGRISPQRMCSLLAFIASRLESLSPTAVGCDMSLSMNVDPKHSTSSSYITAISSSEKEQEKKKGEDVRSNGSWLFPKMIHDLLFRLDFKKMAVTAAKISEKLNIAPLSSAAAGGGGGGGGGVTVTASNGGGGELLSQQGEIFTAEYVESSLPTLCRLYKERSECENAFASELVSIRRTLKLPELQYSSLNKGLSPSSALEYIIEVPSRVSGSGSGSGGKQANVPASWITVKGTQKVSRYYTPEGQKRFDKLQCIRDDIKTALKEAWAVFTKEADVLLHSDMRALVSALGEIDALLSLTKVASQENYTQPEYTTAAASPVTGGTGISSSMSSSSTNSRGDDSHDVTAGTSATGGAGNNKDEEGRADGGGGRNSNGDDENLDAVILHSARHPMVEKYLEIDNSGSFIPNDVLLRCNGRDRCCQIVTGPNMGGKSSYVRMVALICLLGQIGSHVPASYAKLCIFDNILTRMGAGDDLASGQSTFMTELLRTSAILKKATSRSLVILDELGRGTSTHDGVAIAKATVKYFVNKIGCATLFVTHFPQVADMVQVQVPIQTPTPAVVSAPLSRSNDGNNIVATTAPLIRDTFYDADTTNTTASTTTTATNAIVADSTRRLLSTRTRSPAVTSTTDTGDTDIGNIAGDVGAGLISGRAVNIHMAYQEQEEDQEEHEHENSCVVVGQSPSSQESLSSSDHSTIGGIGTRAAAPAAVVVPVSAPAALANEIVFLFKAVEGAAGGSFGINTARLAGMDHDLLLVAQRKADWLRGKTSSS